MSRFSLMMLFIKSLFLDITCLLCKYGWNCTVRPYRNHSPNTLATELVGNPLEKRALMTFYVDTIFWREFLDFFFFFFSPVSATMFGFEIGVRYENKNRGVELTVNILVIVMSLQEENYFSNGSELLR